MAKRTANVPDYEGAKAYALERLERELPSTLFYHSLWHTRDEVAPRAEWLAEQEGLSRVSRLLVGTAAYFHDLGFVERYPEHELGSARIAEAALPRFGYSPAQISLVTGMIGATRIPQSPHNRLDEILADADLDVLGRDDFLARNRSLWAELAAGGVTLPESVWYAQQLRFLQQHRYFTATAREERAARKRENLLALRTLMSQCFTLATYPPIELPNPGFATP